MESMQDILAKMEEDMELRGFSDSTKSTYLRNARNYMEYIAKPLELSSEKDMRDYSLCLRHEKQLEAITINGYLSAIVFLYEVVDDRQLNRKQIPYRKRKYSLPDILTKEEVWAIVNALTNTKHRAILMLAYSAGLRKSEIVKLRVRDIDSDEMRIFVYKGKGGKDRYTLLSLTCLEALRRYYVGHKPDHADDWLFVGQGGRTHMNASSLQGVFENALAKSGVTKNVSLHSLRHAFATHLLEAGTSVFDVKELMGHVSLASTAVYLHLVNMSDRVISPLDVPLDGGK